MQTAETLNRLCYDLGITLYFKSSFDKANRTSASARGVGMDEGLRILSEVKQHMPVAMYKRAMAEKDAIVEDAKVEAEQIVEK